MPELPEVEIARENLERWLVGRRIARAQVADARMRGGQSRRKVESALEGASVRAVLRRGKFLLFDLGAKRARVVAHLGMTGRFVQQPRSDALPRFARASLDVGRGGRVVYCDARRFGQFRLLDQSEERRIEALGVEPLGPDFTARETSRALPNRPTRRSRSFSWTSAGSPASETSRPPRRSFSRGSIPVVERVRFPQRRRRGWSDRFAERSYRRSSAIARPAAPTSTKEPRKTSTCTPAAASLVRGVDAASRESCRADAPRFSVRAARRPNHETRNDSIDPRHPWRPTG